MKRAIFWFRRDLRINDNTGFTEAAEQAAEVTPVFVAGSDLAATTFSNSPRSQFFLAALANLKATLLKHGYPLIIREGAPQSVIPELARELNAQAVFCNKRYEPEAQREDARVFSALNALGIGFEAYKDAVIWEEREIVTQKGDPYTVFTPYAKAWRSRTCPKPVQPPNKQPQRRSKLSSSSLPSSLETQFSIGDSGIQHSCGEAGAIRLLEKFVSEKLPDYARMRDFPFADGTSKLSVHLNCGTIGIRRVVQAVQNATKSNPECRTGAESFINELVWREFYVQILHNFPHVAHGSFRPQFDALPWSGTDEQFQAWCEGMTGYPIIDAAMRCLNQTGWMHNRLRMIVAMFLTKDLLINWQTGEEYFVERLADGDVAANNGGWQWSAGTGTDAAPYFRIFNPVAQGKRFDPGGEFIRRWVPELAHLDSRQIHEPWQVSPLKYPRRIVLHEEQREKALAMYQAVKGRGLKTLN